LSHNTLANEISKNRDIKVNFFVCTLLSLVEEKKVDLTLSGKRLRGLSDFEYLEQDFRDTRWSAAELLIDFR
jgi:hypothetical protein